MIRHTHNELVYYTFDSLSVRHGVFTRLGGVSEGMWSSLNLSHSTGDDIDSVRENRRRMYDAMNATHALTSWLIHSNRVRVVSNADLGQDDIHADAMVTNTRGLALTLRFADCVPVLFHDPQREAIGVAHAGWQGIVNGVLPATVQSMRDTFGCELREIVACIGPSIGPEKFEVGEDVAAKIQGAVSENVIIKNGNPKPYVDLWRSARSQLFDAGLRQIEIGGLCTASDTSEWFSHRAEKGKTGRFGVLAALD